MPAIPTATLVPAKVPIAVSQSVKVAFLSSCSELLDVVTIAETRNNNKKLRYTACFIHILSILSKS